MSYQNTSLLIDGRWRPSASGKTIAVFNPATEEQIGTVAHADRADLDEALAAADKGFKLWRAVAPFERAKIMRKAAALMRERVDSIATLMTMEHGKILAEARIETLVAADVIEWFAEETRRTYGRVIPARGPAYLSDCDQGTGWSCGGFHAVEFSDLSGLPQVVGRAFRRLLDHRQGAGGNAGVSRPNCSARSSMRACPMA